MQILHIPKTNLVAIASINSKTWDSSILDIVNY